jgi:hypothetical protein
MTVMNSRLLPRLHPGLPLTFAGKMKFPDFKKEQEQARRLYHVKIWIKIGDRSGRNFKYLNKFQTPSTKKYSK